MLTILCALHVVPQLYEDNVVEASLAALSKMLAQVLYLHEHSDSARLHGISVMLHRPAPASVD